jgi:hypothetical protein
MLIKSFLGLSIIIKSKLISSYCCLISKEIAERSIFNFPVSITTVVSASSVTYHANHFLVTILSPTS